jgi:hypothetical protein
MGLGVHRGNVTEILIGHERHKSLKLNNSRDG